MSQRRPCEACGATRTTRHHVYPRSFREIWRGQVKQKIAYLCRLCHDVVHLPWRTREVVKLIGLEPENSQWPEYHWRFRDPEVQAILGPYRRIIKLLSRESRALHID